MMQEDEIIPLSPVNFFQISADCLHLPSGLFPTLSVSNLKKYRLPDTSALCAEERFADVALGWSADGIEAFVNVSHRYHRVSYPDVASGDSIELFIDTRDVKTSGYNTRFCHHFFFLPEAAEGKQAGEITRFRTEDTHELCDSSRLQVRSHIKNNGYSINIFIPTQCLNGYDVEQFDRIGFSYRVNRSHGDPQHFSVTSTDYQIEQQPSLWSSLKLIR